MAKEQWTEFPLGYKSKFRYAISNHGQLRSFTGSIANGQLLKCSNIEGYKFLRYKVSKNGTVTEKCLSIHKLVASLFLPDSSAKQTYVLHLDYNKSNNHVDNLQWATAKEMIEHREKNPAVVRGHLRTTESIRQSGKGHKLTATKVQFLKKKLLDPNYKTSMKILARQFGVSQMALSRIRTGENWGHIKV
ncbi:MAG: NUMOD4 domain-containing protein [Candidatus Woesearchaeota archaeon]|nr:NUMOD4 domain-containing protein [Candidatus Woesearchaeota archaeon]